MVYGRISRARCKETEARKLRLGKLEKKKIADLITARQSKDWCSSLLSIRLFSLGVFVFVFVVVFVIAAGEDGGGGYRYLKRLIRSTQRFAEPCYDAGEESTCSHEKLRRCLVMG